MLLGSAQARIGDVPLHLPTRKGLWLLAFLSLEGQQERGVLASLLWGEAGEEQARGQSPR